MPTRIRCQVIEVPTEDDWLARRGRAPRELLPWADPYIAGLMRRLEKQRGEDAEVRCDPFDSSMEADNSSLYDDGWQEDAFMPQPVEAPRFHSYPPVYGGFPLLEE